MGISKTKLTNANIPNKFCDLILKYYPDKFDFKNYEFKNFYFHGETGVGKTLTSIALSLYLLNDKITSYNLIFGNVPEILFELRNTYNKKEYTEENIINKYSDPKILILDDLGVEKTSDWTMQSLYLIINRRYNDDKITITTSNKSPKEIQEKMDDGRIISRLTSNAKVIKLKK